MVTKPTMTTPASHANAARNRCAETDPLAAFQAVRARTLALVEPLSAEDMMVQTLPEASPVKWHLAHTSWFFESFVLAPFVTAYRSFHPDFKWLFNSYYQSFAAFPDKHLRASFSRPSLEEILAYRRHVDAAMLEFAEQILDQPEAAARCILGVHHEQQHQELILTDLLHGFASNPLHPAYRDLDEISREAAQPLAFTDWPGGLVETGADASEGFSYDHEQPRHRAWIDSFRLANRLVTNGEFAAFMEDGGYSRPELWLSDGWQLVQSEGWQAPLYWRKTADHWRVMSLHGELPLDAIGSYPACHVSYYEADALARWAGKRLPTEEEWEHAAQGVRVEGNLLEQERYVPLPAAGTNAPLQLFGDCWEWTASAYLPYAGFRPLAGALGEYNGKFMSGKMVLRGGSFATPASHIRASYRNFFVPETRWQFSGIRLAETSA